MVMAYPADLASLWFVSYNFWGETYDPAGGSKKSFDPGGFHFDEVILSMLVLVLDVGYAQIDNNQYGNRSMMNWL